MKQIKLLLGSLLFSGLLAVTHAQDYQISYTGSGLRTTVDSVRVTNLAQGTTLTLGSEDVLHLVGTITGIKNDINPGNNLGIYPNPMMDKSRIEFHNSEKGRVNIEIFDVTGKNVLRHSEFMDQGTHSFEISNLNVGLYLVNVSTPKGKLAEKLLSGSETSGNTTIRYQGNQYVSSHKSTLKSSQAVIQMQYNEGERLLFRGISGNYIRVVTLIPTQTQTVNFEFVASTDVDQNNYPVVTIGTQTWMAENLKTTRYNDSAAIAYPGANNAEWESNTTGAYTWYNNMDAYKNKYGALYNWFAVNTGKLCPTGWHVATDAEWSTLESYLIDNGFNYDGTQTDNKIAKSLAATTDWNTSSTPGAVGNTDYPQVRNATGFSGLPASYRNITGEFGDLGNGSSWWTGSGGIEHAYYRGLNFNNPHSERKSYFRNLGFAVRCIMD